MELRRRHILSAAGAAALLHGAIAVGLFWEPVRSGAIGAGSGGLEISLGALGGAPGLAAPVAPGEVTESAIDRAETEPPEADPAETSGPPEADTADPLEVDTAEAPLIDTTQAEARAPLPPDLTEAPPETAEARPERIAAAQPPQAPAQATALAPPPEPVLAEPEVAEPILAETAEPTDPLPETSTAEEFPREVEPLPAPEEIVETREVIETALAAEPEPLVTTELAVPVAAEPPKLSATAPNAVVEATVPLAEPLEAEETDPDAFTTPMPRARPKDLAPPKPAEAKTKPKAKAKPTPKTAAKPKPKAEPKPKPVQQAARTGGDAAARTQDTRGQGQAGASGNSDSAGQGQRASAGGKPGARRDYLTRVSAILSRNKRYPRRARSRRQQGTGHLYFVVEQSGRIASMRLQKSSGHSPLDKEILAILGRVGKLPPIPQEVGVARLEIVVPINFRLR